MLKKWLILAAALLLILAGCSKEKTVSEHADKGIGSSPKETGAQYSYPLTGLKTNEEPEGRAFAVVINNHPKARPQSGLDKADIIYEVLTEGKVTRFLAVFQSSSAERIGPVRSARDYFIELAKGYDAFFVAHGYSPEAKQLLSSGYIDNINGMQYDGTLFKRSSDRVAPHNSYISTKNIIKGGENLGYDLEKPPASLTFLSDGEIEGLNGEKAVDIKVSYSNSQFDVTYKYDEKQEKYERYTSGQITKDLDSGNPVLLDNIFIVETNHKVVDNAGRRDVDLVSGGKGLLFQKGVCKEVEWKNIDGRILPFENGKESGFVPGKTWINIVPQNPGLENTVKYESGVE